MSRSATLWKASTWLKSESAPPKQSFPPASTETDVAFTTGRDHNPKGYTSWLAGGGIQGGVIHGGTDEVGYKAVDSPHYYSDLHATILRQLGLDHKKMKVQALGRTMRLVEEGGPINEIIA